MKLRNKSIVNENEKICSICNKPSSEGGVTILNNYICEDCINVITKEKMDNPRYMEIKDKIKNIFIKNL